MGAHGSGRRTDDAPRRMSLSEIVELLLTKGGGEHSSVSLSRNAKGETQIEVTVRTGEGGEVTTARQAAAEAQTIYDQLRSAYPLASGTTGAVAA
jgi:hypothetical protein